jgi:short-subunit dehydrogenase
MRTLPGSVVVITGASSGMGRATARSLAAQGAELVLVARGVEPLEATAFECRALGAEVVAIAADVGVPADVDRIVSAAVDRFGHVDTWIHLASVLLVGELPTQPVDEMRELVMTNVYGNALVSRAALTQFRAQGHGVLIDVSSLLGVVPNPLVPTYCMSKFAALGLSLSLQQSLPRRSRVKVCSVLPGPIDTPLFRRAANHSGHEVRAISPATSPERAAAVIVACARRPRRQVTTGLSGRLILLGCRVVPGFTRWLVAQAAARLIINPWPAAETAGELYGGRGTGAVSGDFRRVAVRRRLGDAIGRWSARRVRTSTD